MQIRVMEARNLPAMDFGGTSDPYVVVTCENKTKKTSTQFKTLQPAWNETLYFCTTAAELDTVLPHVDKREPPAVRLRTCARLGDMWGLLKVLYVECFDYDFGSKDDSCGACEVDLTGLQARARPGPGGNRKDLCFRQGLICPTFTFDGELF